MLARPIRSLSAAVQSPVIVFLIALGLRFWTLSQLLPEKANDYFYRYNEPSRIAWALVSGYGFSSPWPHTPLAPTAQQPPIYPFLVAGVFRLAGAYSYRSLWIAVGLNAIFSALSAVMILRLGKRDFGPVVGVLAAWVWSCWLYETAVSVRLWESSLTALLLLAALWMLPSLADSLRCSQWLMFGFLAGVALLTNTTLLAVFGPFWIWLWLTYQRRNISSSKVLLASIGVCFLVLTPWTIRNYQTFHRLVPIRDNFGMELWIGNHDGVTNRYPAEFPVLNPDPYNRMGEIQFMESRRRIAFEFISSHPRKFLQLCIRRFFKYWTDPEPALWLPVSILAALGSILVLRSEGVAGVPYVMVVIFFPLVYYIAHTYDTYRHPAEPEILLLASYATVTTVQAAHRLLRRDVA